MFIGTELMFDNVKLSDMGLIVVDVDSNGMKEVPFGMKRTIVEEVIGSRRYLNRVDKEPLPIPVTLALKQEYKFDYEKRRDIVNLLFQDDYKALISEDHPGIAYYCIVEGDSKRFDNYLNDGYVTLNFRCDAPHGWSYPMSVEEFDLSDNTGTTIITMNNLSNVEKYYKPEIEIEFCGTNYAILKNLTDGGKEFSFSGLQLGETVYVNNQNKRIKSSLGDDVYRLEKFNKGGWLGLHQGLNYIEVTGKCIIRTKMQYPIAL